MYGCESWTIKKAECWRIDAFELWYSQDSWEPSPRRSNQSILKEIGPEYSLEGLMLVASNTLATWCKELTHWRRPWCWERLKAGGEGDDRGWNGWMASLTRWTWVWVSSGNWWWTGRHGVPQSMGSQCRTRLGNWTELWGGGYQEEVLGTHVPCLHGFPVQSDSEREPQAGLGRPNSPPYRCHHLHPQPNQGGLPRRIETEPELWAYTSSACYWFYLPSRVSIKSATWEERITTGRKREAAFSPWCQKFLEGDTCFCVKSPTKIRKSLKKLWETTLLVHQAQVK